MVALGQQQHADFPACANLQTPPLSGLRKVKTKLKGLLLLQEQASSATFIILRVREAATRISRHPLCLRTFCQGNQVLLGHLYLIKGIITASIGRNRRCKQRCTTSSTRIGDPMGIITIILTKCRRHKGNTWGGSINKSLLFDRWSLTTSSACTA